MLSIDVRLLYSSGIGRYLSDFLSQLSDEKLDDLVVLYSSTKKILNDFSFPDNVSIKFVDSKIYSIREQFIFYKLLDRHDIHWSPHYNIPLLYRGKLLTTIHDVAHLALPDIYNTYSKKLYSKIFYDLAAKKSDIIICVSEFTKEELIKYTGVTSNRVRVIHNGIDRKWFNSIETHNPVGKPYILCVGNVKPHKNIKTLIKSFSKIKDKIPHDIILVGKKDGFITGDSELVDVIKGLEDRVNFTGFIKDELLLQYYSFADVFVFPSLYEGFGYPPLEAMARECPVICSNAASMPEICGNAVEYFNPTDYDELIHKILTLLNDEGLRQSLKVKGIEQCQKYSLDKMYNKTIQTIRQMYII